jgi:hypothetical protein
VGRALFERCVADARLAGVCTFECYSSIMAEAFYRALGFRTVEPMKIALGDTTIPRPHALPDDYRTLGGDWVVFEEDEVGGSGSPAIA